MWQDLKYDNVCFKPPTVYPTVFSPWNFFLSPRSLSCTWYYTSLKSIGLKSVRQFSCSVESDSLPPHELQHARPPCPSPTPGVHPNSCPLSWWCHPTISSSVVPFSSVFNLSQHQGLFRWVSSSHQVAKVLEFQLQHQSFQWTPRTHFLLGWTGWISLQSLLLFIFIFWGIYLVIL